MSTGEKAILIIAAVMLCHTLLSTKRRWKAMDYLAVAGWAAVGIGAWLGRVSEVLLVVATVFFGLAVRRMFKARTTQFADGLEASGWLCLGITIVADLGMPFLVAAIALNLTAIYVRKRARKRFLTNLFTMVLDEGKRTDLVNPVKKPEDVHKYAKPPEPTKFLSDRDIVKSTYTTDLYSEFVMLLHSSRQLDEAVSTCLGWWKLCRRYRMLGHAECLLALNQLALCLLDQGRADEAIGMQNYRLQLVRQSRGRLFPMAQSAEMEVEMFTLLAKAKQSPRRG